MSVFWEALLLVSEPQTLGAILIASCLGITLGAIPGLTAVMGVADTSCNFPDLGWRKYP